MLKTEIKYSNRERCFIRKIDSLALSHVFLSINKNAVILALQFVRLKHRDRSYHMPLAVLFLKDVGNNVLRSVGYWFF